MKIKYGISAALIATLAFAGCSSNEVITTQNALTDTLKAIAAIDSSSTPEAVSAAMEKIVEATTYANDYQLECVTTIDDDSYQSLDDGTFSLVENNSTVKSIVSAVDNNMYEFLETDSFGTQIGAIGHNSPDGAVQVSLEVAEGNINDANQMLKIGSISEAKSNLANRENASDIIKEAISLNLYTSLGGTMIIQPMTNPDYYNFELRKNGDAYIWTITMNDKARYNEKLNVYSEETLGYKRTDLKGDGSLVVQVNETESVTITVTMNQDGVISQIQNQSDNKMGNEGNVLDLKSDQKLVVTKAPSGNVDFFRDIFNRIKDGSITQGATLKVDMSIPEVKEVQGETKAQ